jgi:hypothetical protein
MRAAPRYQPARRLRLVIVLTALALAACAQPSTVHTVSNPEASFDHYRTFSFGAAEGLPRGYATSPWSAEMRRRIQPLIVAALTQRGYSLASGKGDLVIRFGSGRRVVTVQEATPPEGEQSEVEPSFRLRRGRPGHGHRCVRRQQRRARVAWIEPRRDRPGSRQPGAGAALRFRVVRWVPYRDAGHTRRAHRSAVGFRADDEQAGVSRTSRPDVRDAPAL